MSSKFDSFEKGLQESMQGFEVPYKDGSWEELQARMAPGSGSGNANWLIAASIVGAVAVGGVVFATMDDESALGKGAGQSELTLNSDSFNSIRLKTEEYLLSQDLTVEYTDALANVSESNTAEPSSAESNVANQTASTVETSIQGNLATIEGGTAPSNTTSDSNDATADVIEEEVVVEDEIVLPAMGDKPAMPISISTREGCVGTQVDFVISANHEDSNYLWNFGDGNFSNSPNPSHVYKKAGTYDITLSVTSSKDGVIRTKTMDNLIVINPQPEANFNWEFEDSPVGSPVVFFNNSSKRAEKAEWIIVDEYSTEINPSMQIDKKGKHTIELVVSNEFGCSDRISKEIEINADYSLMAPTKFSPNDDGVFDTFMPRALMESRKNFVLKVKNGDQVVYETTDASKAWKGQLPDGSKVTPGQVYTWSCVVQSVNGEKYYSGTITITP